MPLVLMYHSVEKYDEDPYRVTVHPDRFARQLRWLHRRGLRGVSMRELLQARHHGRAAGLVGLTFDDGYADFRTEVQPALDAYGFGATLYVVAGLLGGHNGWDEPGPRKPLLTATDVRAVADSGVEIGAHSLTHPYLSTLDDEDLAVQVGRSREILRQLTGQEVAGFCYPYGDAGPREIAAVRAAGFDHACATRPSAVTGRYAIPRTYIGDRDSAPRLYAKAARHRLTAGRAG